MIFCFSEKPEKILLSVKETPKHLHLSCTVYGCVPAPEVSLFITGSVIPKSNTSVYTSINTSTVTGSVILSSVRDNAAIQCQVAVLNTNYTDTIQEYYTRYTQHAMAVPYTSHGSKCDSSYQQVIAVIIFLLLVKSREEDVLHQ